MVLLSGDVIQVTRVCVFVYVKGVPSGVLARLAPHALNIHRTHSLGPGVLYRTKDSPGRCQFSSGINI